MAAEDGERRSLTTADHDDAVSAAHHVVAPSGVHIWGYHFATHTVAIGASCAMVLVGLGLGFVVAAPSQDPAPWDRISAVVGWWYFNAWAVSFLPQLYLNYVRKCVIGQSFDYVFMNVLGFFSYSVYTISFYGVTSVQQEYEQRYGDANTVDANDVGFAVYAFACTVLNSYQIARYDRGGQVPTRTVLFGIAGTVAVMLVWLIALLCGVRTQYVFNTLDILYGLSVVKLGVSLIKYIPQVYLNYKRKCTVGWNIWNVMLDFTGGFLSVVQQLIDCGTTGRWNGIAGNPVKFCLGSLSMVYDVMFMLQHFYLYKENNRRLHEEQLAAAHKSSSASVNIGSFQAVPQTGAS